MLPIQSRVEQQIPLCQSDYYHNKLTYTGKEPPKRVVTLTLEVTKADGVMDTFQRD